MISYRATYQLDDSDKTTFDFDEATDDFDLFNSDLSNVFSNNYFTHQVGAGYSIRDGEKIANIN